MIIFEGTTPGNMSRLTQKMLVGGPRETSYTPPNRIHFIQRFKKSVSPFSTKPLQHQLYAATPQSTTTTTNNLQRDSKIKRKNKTCTKVTYFQVVIYEMRRFCHLLFHPRDKLDSCVQKDSSINSTPTQYSFSTTRNAYTFILPFSRHQSHSLAL